MTPPLDTIEMITTSSRDGSPEAALFHHPGGLAPVPLVVGLHIWSCDRYNQLACILPLCQERGWALL